MVKRVEISEEKLDAKVIKQAGDKCRGELKIPFFRKRLTLNLMEDEQY